MLKTDKGMVELRLEDDWNNVKNTIVDRLIEAFQMYPHCFFTEHDIHSVLYNITKEGLELNGVMTVKTSDGYEVMLVHHEFPTPFRCDMQDYGFRRAGEEERTPKGGLHKRGHYDLVIFNPEFVRKSELKVVYGKDYQIFRLAMQEVTVEPLIWACEVVFFPRVKRIPKNAMKIIKQDALKVKETLRHKVGRDVNFCKMGSVLVFTNHTAEEVSDLRQQVSGLDQVHKLGIIILTAVRGYNLGV